MKTSILPASRFDAILGIVHDDDFWKIISAPPFAWAIDGRRFQGPEYSVEKWPGLFLNSEDSRFVMFRPEFGLEVLRESIREIVNDDPQNLDYWPEILVDMTKKSVHNLYFEQPIETWIPDDWQGAWDEFLDLLPEDVRSIWPGGRPIPSRSIPESWIKKWTRRLFWR